MPSYGVTVDLSGPIFRQNTGEIVARSTHRVVQKVVEVAEQRLAARLRKRPEGVYLSTLGGGKSTGNYRRNVTGGVMWAGPYSAMITDQGVVYGPWLEGVSSRNSGSGFPGYHVFRETRQWLEEKAVPAIVNGEAQRLAKELGGD